MARLAMDDPFFLARALKWYKRRDVQEAIIAACDGREVSPRFGQGFGKRPDALYYPADILAFAKRKATSFHCSEERWRDPLQLQTGSSRKVLDELRTGWDLVLDIDCPYWFFSKLTTQLFLDALAAYGVTEASVKFSGNKGFHIGVPFEAFPPVINNQPTKNLFPEAPRAIARLLLHHISTHLITVKENTIIFKNQYKISFEKLQAVTGKEASAFLHQVCLACGTPKETRTRTYLFLCTTCGRSVQSNTYDDYKECTCGSIMELQPSSDEERCGVCGGRAFAPRFNVQALIEVDTVLLASRHLFRTPYSLHEKSGLVSIVIPPDEVMRFEKEAARPGKVRRFPRFLEPARVTPGSAGRLLQAALDFQATRATSREEKAYAVPEEAIPEAFFPPCMQHILQGLEDGKKRAMFALTNFLRACGWGHDQIAARLTAWNKINPEPLRDVVLQGHLRYLKQKKEIYPPPNCKSFYQDIGVCQPDNLCRHVKNPVQYAKRRAEAPRKKGRPKLTEEQKAMRKAWREKQRGE